MKINYIFHEFQEKPPEFDFSAHNLIVCAENELLDERKLCFGPIVCRSSIGFKTQLESSLRSIGWPNLIWPFNQKATSFGYSNWFMYYDGFHTYDDMLNHDACLWNTNGVCESPLNAKILKYKWDEYCEYFGSEKIWIRSESGSKLFSGGVYTKEQFDVEHEYLRQNGKLEEWLVIAPPKQLRREWRLFIVDNKVISSSQYMRLGEIEILPPNKTPKNVIKFAANWAEKWGHNWSGAFVLDVCELLEENSFPSLKVVEINSINTSGAYEADMTKVIGAINQSISKTCRTLMNAK